jgi:hypothetical protein
MTDDAGLTHMEPAVPPPERLRPLSATKGVR